MGYVEGTDRNQLLLFEEKIDEMIAEEHLVRFIDVYVNKIDLVKLEIFNAENKIGSPGYDPALYLKIYIYSYLNKIRSSRKIERECKINIELIWLTCRLSPDHWSISNFRKKNTKALKNIFKEFLRFCHKLNLLSFKLVAIDGTKLRAQNSQNNIYKKQEIDKQLEKYERKINEYIAELETNDKKEQDEFEFLNKNIPQKLRQLEKHKEKLEFVKEIFKENPELERYFANDPDCNFQKDNGRCITGYNCQSAVDEKNKLIVAIDVTNENNDSHQINNMTNKLLDTKHELEAFNNMKVVADAGYHTETELLIAFKKNEIDLFIPNPRDVKKPEKNCHEMKDLIPCKGYEKEDFTYDKDNNIFICPEKKILEQLGNGSDKSGIQRIRYQCKNCSDCEKFNLCTTNKKGRIIDISENFIEMEKFRDKVKSELGKKIVQKRKELVEHPFGTIKRSLGFTYFMQTGIEKVKAEYSFISFIYNFKRVIKIVGVGKLIEALSIN